ncbi:hypothetical protein OFM39_32215, partial [Escherichia coli]|nr:hypothetical protein [Escherichia coli]
KNKEVFPWSYYYMPGVDPKVFTHRLNVNPNYEPVHQKRRKFGVERNEVINEEVRFIRQVQYPDWLTNVVVVPKKNGSHMYVSTSQ